METEAVKCYVKELPFEFVEDSLLEKSRFPHEPSKALPWDLRVDYRIEFIAARINGREQIGEIEIEVFHLNDEILDIKHSIIQFSLFSENVRECDPNLPEIQPYRCPQFGESPLYDPPVVLGEILFIDDEVVRIKINGDHKYPGEAPFIYGVNWGSAYDFLESIFRSRYKAGNKEVMIARLNTWYKVVVVGQNGGIRTQALIRHTLPDGNPASWNIVPRQGGRGLWLQK